MPTALTSGTQLNHGLGSSDSGADLEILSSLKLKIQHNGPGGDPASDWWRPGLCHTRTMLFACCPPQSPAPLGETPAPGGPGCFPAAGPSVWGMPGSGLPPTNPHACRVAGWAPPGKPGCSHLKKAVWKLGRRPAHVLKQVGTALRPQETQPVSAPRAPSTGRDVEAAGVLPQAPRWSGAASWAGELNTQSDAPGPKQRAFSLLVSH